MAKEMMSIDEQIKQELAQVNETVADESMPRIKTKGKVFTLPDGNSSPGPMRAIILDFVNLNKYYPGVYNPNDIKPPACYAIAKRLADMAPASDAAEKQADGCPDCPKNQWGSDPQGGKGKACKNTKRLAVIEEGADGDSPVYLLDVSPMGLRNFDGYVKRLGNLQDPKLPFQVVTEISFDPNMDYPRLVFNAGGLVEDLSVVAKLRPYAQSLLQSVPDND